tara:strand:+ start:1236 stop:2009 length:774 start_codon:yes stop_codon:yes gene_type:complete
MRPIILFDMDGTLTLPRQKISRDVVDALKEKSKDFDIGIVTGSDYDYVMEQCMALFELSGVPCDKVLLFPCNGTKSYKWKYTQYQLAHSVDMIDKISVTSYKKILSKLFDFQSEMLLFYPDIPLTGTFFHYRGSMLNWCPIGRLASQEHRDIWKKLDKDYAIRKEYMSLIEAHILSCKADVTVALGGSTSFDIYPKGWDKTYVMNHLDEYEEIYFIGDKCGIGGNDKELFDLLSSSGRSYVTKSPKQTIDIISKILI